VGTERKGEGDGEGGRRRRMSVGGKGGKVGREAWHP
jgi:hypothetical protein